MTSAFDNEIERTGLASHGQRRIWAAERTAAWENAQVIPLAFEIEGPVDVDRFEKAIASVIEAHEALHTTLKFYRGNLHRHVQSVPFHLQFVDLSQGDFRQTDVAQLEHEFFRRRFDLSADAMLKALLIREPQKHTMLFAFHHSAADGYSIDIIRDHISRIYSGESEELVFADVIPCDVYHQSVEIRETKGDFEGPAEAAILSLELGPERDEIPDFWSSNPSCRFQRFNVDADIHDAIVAASIGHIGLGVSALYLAAFHIFLSAALGRNTISIGFPVSNRSNPDHKNIVGFLTNIVPVRASLTVETSLGSSLKNYVSTLQTLRSRLDLPYGLLLKKIHNDDEFRFDTVPVEVLFTYQLPPVWPLRISGCLVKAKEPALWPVVFPLMLDIDEGASGISALLRWDAAKYPEYLASVLSETYSQILKALVANQEAQTIDLVRWVRSKIDDAEVIYFEKAQVLRKSYLNALFPSRRAS